MRLRLQRLRLQRLRLLQEVTNVLFVCVGNQGRSVIAERLFRRAELRQMKRTAYLINVGRGIIVDLDDLVAALRAGEIAGAGLDVFEIEPLPADHPLWAMENVIITPHVAGCSPRIAERHLEVVLENTRRFVRGEPLINVADKRRWY